MSIIHNRFVKRNYFTIIILFIVGLYILSSFYFPFKTDEEVSMALVNKSFHSLINTDALDVHPPLYYLSLKIFLIMTSFWTKSIFVKTFFARIFSLLLFVLFISSCLKILEICNVHIDAKYQILIYMLVPGVINEITKIRMYSMSSCLIALELYELLRFINNNKNVYIILSTIFASLTSYTFYPAALSAGFFLLIFCVSQFLESDKRLSFKIFISIVFLLILYIPWAGNVINQIKVHSGKDGMITTNYFDSFIMSITQLRFNGPHFLLNYLVVASLILIALIGALIVYLVKTTRSKFSNIILYCLTNFGLTLIVTIVICKHQYRSNSVYPIFSILMFLLITELILKLRIITSLIFKAIIILSLIICVGYSSGAFLDNVIKYDEPSITLISNFSKWKNSNNKNINIDKYIKANKPTYATQDSIYLASINKKAVVNKNILNINDASSGTLNNSHDHKLFKKLFTNLYFK